MISFLVKALPHFCVGIVATYLLMRLLMFAVGGPGSLALTYTTVAGIVGAVALIVAALRDVRRAHGSERPQQLSDSPGRVECSILGALTRLGVGLVLAGFGMVLLLKFNRLEGVLLLVLSLVAFLVFGRYVRRTSGQNALT